MRHDLHVAVTPRVQQAIASVAIVTCTALLPQRVLGADFMDCGQAKLCGVLTLETGLGRGAYEHEMPRIHGLWPEVGKYGSSECIRPEVDAAPETLYPCYAEFGVGAQKQLAFEKHEWGKHGTCAGVRDADDYFQQACELSREPLRVMAASRATGATDLGSFRSQLEAAGYPVYASNTRTMQLELSACATNEGRWVIARPMDFNQVCAPRPTEPSTSSTSAPLAQCVRNQKGPRCTSDTDCGFSGCVRCAKSGFCTDQALMSPT